MQNKYFCFVIYYSQNEFTMAGPLFYRNLEKPTLKGTYLHDNQSRIILVNHLSQHHLQNKETPKFFLVFIVFYKDLVQVLGR